MPALETMRVLDMTQYEAGPSCTQWLAWLGADVVKVEPPRGEVGRRVFAEGDEDSQYFLNYNANKRSVVLDLQQAEGRELLLRLVPRFDVLVENLGPGVMERLGLDPDAVRALNPRLIYTRIKGFGLDGPYARYKSFDQLAQAAAGVFSMTGLPDGPPIRPGGTFADSGTGVQAALGITAAYVQQQRTGEGQTIEISMHEAMTMFIRTTAVQRWGGPEPSPRQGNRTLGGSELYPCRPFGPNDFVYVVAITTRMWESLCAAIGRPELVDDPRFARTRDREANADALYEEIAAWTRGQTKQDAMRTLAEAGVPCSAVFDTADVFADPHLRARDFVHTVEHPAEGPVTLLGSPLRLSASDVPLAPPPLAGQHSDEVLAKELGLDGDALAGLRSRGVVS